jgi:negative regulator of sigma E activity
LNGELDAADASATLDTLAGDADQRDRYTLYGLIGDVLRGNSTPDDGFSVRIFERLRAEGVKVEDGYDPLAG